MSERPQFPIWFGTTRKPGRLGFRIKDDGWNTSHGFVSRTMYLMAHAKILRDVDVSDPDGVEAALQEIQQHITARDWEWTLRSPPSWAD